MELRMSNNDCGPNNKLKTIQRWSFLNLLHDEAPSVENVPWALESILQRRIESYQTKVPDGQNSFSSDQRADGDRLGGRVVLVLHNLVAGQCADLKKSRTVLNQQRLNVLWVVEDDQLKRVCLN